ncbi:cistern family PEP-CTERM protein [Mastigocladopsis repens]|uniref:cistern family PEP-CTERM protein n=1 Tax=Mastigocladopsis repens TaxID=221287 RepID=UPI0002DBBEFD|nr:cistern family PEP-CTERM protein [Mastigocladopsis repens]
MSMRLSKLVFGISTASLVGLYCLTFAPSASAKSSGKTVDTSGTTTTNNSSSNNNEGGNSNSASSGSDTTTSNSPGGSSKTSTRPLPLLEFTSSDIGKTFQFNFDGNVNEQNVSGLSSTALFTLKNFAGNEATFDVALDNTSSDGITSRTSALGFNVYSDLNSTNQLSLVGIGDPSGSGNTRVSGLFSNDRSGSFPNQFGDIDVCFTNGNTCQGGSNGGISTNDGIGNFSFTLAFENAVNSFALGNFGVRYQSIDGNGFNGDSGTGRGTYNQTQQVPEPGTSAALGLFAVGALVVMKKTKSISPRAKQHC